MEVDFYVYTDKVDYEICAVVGCYAASNGNTLPTFRDDVSVPSSRVKTFSGA
jgi:hypothetical protein